MNHSHKRKRVADAESAETKQPNIMLTPSCGEAITLPISPKAIESDSDAADLLQPTLQTSAAASSALPPRNIVLSEERTNEDPSEGPPLPTPPVIPSGALQPAGNRARFLAGMQPNKVSCDLSSAPTNPGMRFSFEAIIVVAFPAKTTPPERRYIELMDEYGTTGITVWNSYVHAVKPSSVGCVVKFSRLSLSMHNGKKSLTMAKDSTMHVEEPNHVSHLSKWWTGLLTEPAITCAKFHDMPAASIVNVSGILGFISQEEKIVNGELKLLLILYITDKTGKIEIRSWNHSDVEFMQYRERPLLFNRVKVSLYAGNRTADLLTGMNGTQITTSFDSRELEAYWNE
jgi:hypothetical protein